MQKDILLYHPFMIPFVHYALQSGMTGNCLSNEFQINTSNLNVPTYRLSAGQYKQMIQKLVEKTEDEHPGIAVAKTLHIEHFGLVGYIMMNCNTIAEALQKYNQYQQISGNAIHSIIETKGDRIQFYWPMLHPDLSEIKRILLEGSILATMRLYGYLSGEEQPPAEVWFDFPRPNNTDIYERTYKAELKFNKPWTGVIFNQKHLDVPVKVPNRDLLSVFENCARERFRYLLGHRYYSDRVVKLLSRRKSSIPSLGSISRELKMGKKNLQLKLRNEGTTFRELRNEIQCERAKNYLKSQHYSAVETAYLLGYSDPGTFCRNFKRWTGMTTKEFRIGN